MVQLFYKHECIRKKQNILNITNISDTKCVRHWIRHLDREFVQLNIWDTNYSRRLDRVGPTEYIRHELYLGALEIYPTLNIWDTNYSRRLDRLRPAEYIWHELYLRALEAAGGADGEYLCSARGWGWHVKNKYLIIILPRTLSRRAGGSGGADGKYVCSARWWERQVALWP